MLVKNFNQCWASQRKKTNYGYKFQKLVHNGADHGETLN